MLWDDKNLYVSFRCQDAHVWGVHTKHDDPVYKDDCVEVFTSPNPDHPETVSYTHLTLPTICSV